MGKDTIEVVAAVIEDGARYLITQRQANAVLPLLWEFPGGRVELEEDPEQALAREVYWRIGVHVTVDAELGQHVHEYEHYDVHLTMFRCTIPEGAMPRAVNVNDIVWVASSCLCDYQFPPADEQTMNKLLGLKCD